jgi:hypothetical protein
MRCVCMTEAGAGRLPVHCCRLRLRLCLDHGVPSREFGPVIPVDESDSRDS